MFCNTNYQNVIERLKNKAKILSAQIGFYSFDVDQVEEDFINYLNSKSINDVYPLFGGTASLADYVNNMKYYSGTGNPFSPIIYVGSELASNLEEDKSLYFKISADLQWKEIFNIPTKCPFVLDHIKRKFVEKWDGAKESKFNAVNCRFYKTLRETLINDPQFAYDYPFIVYQTLYHTTRNNSNGSINGHEWNVANKFLSILTNSEKCYEYYESKNREEGFQKPNPTDKFIDEQIFMTECNLKPAASGQNNGSQLNQFIFSELLDKFKQKRIIILHPTTGIRQQCKSNKSYQIASLFRYASLKNSLEIYNAYSNKHTIIFSPQNLSAAVTNKLLCDLAYVVKKFR